jgi:hypothetical protein
MANGAWSTLDLTILPMSQANISSVLVGDIIYYNFPKDNLGQNFYKFDLLSNTTTTLPSPPRYTGRQLSGARLFWDGGNRIYHIGGNTDYGWLSCYSIFHLDTQLWDATVTNLNFDGTYDPNGEVTFATIYNNVMYVFDYGNIGKCSINGSTGALTPTSLVNHATDGFLRNNTANNAGITYTNAIRVGSKVYFAGVANASYYKKLVSYDLEFNLWDYTLANVSGPTDLTAPAYFNGTSMWNYGSKIYCYGTSSSGGNITTDKIVRVYDITNNTWSVGADLGIYRGHTSAINYYGSIYLLGGFNGASVAYGSPTNFITKYTYVLAKPTNLTVTYENSQVVIRCVDNSDEEDYYVITRKRDDEVSYTQITPDGTLTSIGGNITYIDSTADVLYHSYEYKLFCKKLIV